MKHCILSPLQGSTNPSNDMSRKKLTLRSNCHEGSQADSPQPQEMGTSDHWIKLPNSIESTSNELQLHQLQHEKYCLHFHAPGVEVQRYDEITQPEATQVHNDSVGISTTLSYLDFTCVFQFYAPLHYIYREILHYI